MVPYLAFALYFRPILYLYICEHRLGMDIDTSTRLEGVHMRSRRGSPLQAASTSVGGQYRQRSKNIARQHSKFEEHLGHHPWFITRLLGDIASLCISV
jgi:hypothetical protein